ncbi:C4-dicarboxylate TRAP transporter substrate-binding protein [Tropicimonas isoalkanivorans]|uniref:TRAP-type C4-dicarboxylate transport system, substrate-binding protein n=1 Tax=Tropicimonas isoalkanivorans TaxID=441112 RepID=A0A1I1HYP8_9RHOB|nr:C4-dicarboxylate TRAP transporter substrate-binding protein [Tropicimonas isoalkanivorans]SFC28961.1 TRAP-type C4-dicarboxylate transport system, substrate-binding protein [Tropicimonas isoalkanivorans]
MTLNKKTIALAAASAALTAAPALADTLIYGSALPSIHQANTVVVEPYAEAVAQATDGEVDIQLTAGGALAGNRETLGAVSDGALDMGLITDFYTPTELPNSTMISDLGVLGKDARVITAAVNENLLIACKTCKADYEELGIVPMMMYSTTPYHVMCKGVDANALANLKGVKIRATGAMGQLMAGIGANPVNLQTTEAYEAMQRGSISCIAGSIPWLKTYQLGDMVTSVNMMALGTFHGTLPLNINADRWAELSDEQRAAMIEAIPARVRAIAKSYEDDDISVREDFEAKGVSFVEADQAFIDAVEAHAASDVERVGEAAGDRGAVDPEASIAVFQGLVEKWTGIVNDIGEGAWDEAQWDAYEQKIREEIYEKAEF